MKLSLGTGDNKKQTLMAVVAIVAILLAVGLLARNFIGSNPAMEARPAPPGTQFMPPPGEEMMGVPPPTPPGADSVKPEAATAPEAPPAPNAAAPPAPPQAEAPPPAAAPPRPTPAAPAVAAPEMKQLKVFGSVNVSYPAGWKIAAGGGNSSAIFTDGNARFAVHAPDPKADTAKKIAEAAMNALTPGAVITAQGTDKVAGNDAHWFAVKHGGKVARVVGIDGPTRVALVQTVKTGDFSKYRETFNSMQSGITFVGR